MVSVEIEAVLVGRGVGGTGSEVVFQGRGLAGEDEWRGGRGAEEEERGGKDEERGEKVHVYGLMCESLWIARDCSWLGRDDAPMTVPNREWRDQAI